MMMDEGLFRAWWRPLEIAGEGGEMGLEALRRIAHVQMDGARSLFEALLGQLAVESADPDPSSPWLASYRRAVAGGTEVSLRCFRTSAALQAEIALLADELLPEIARKLLGPISDLTQPTTLTSPPSAREIARRIAA